MENKRSNLILGLFGVVLLILTFYCIRDYQRDLQHRSVERYIDSGQLFKTMADYGWTTNRMQDFSVSIESGAIFIQVDTHSKQEFNRFALMASRTDRPRVEHVTVRFIENISRRR